jgi:hypothetical protein
VVQGETEKEAFDFLDYYANQKGDWDAVTNLVETMGINAKTFTAEQMKDDAFHRRLGRIPIVGTGSRLSICQETVRLRPHGVLLTLLIPGRHDRIRQDSSSAGAGRIARMSAVANRD